MPWPIGVMSFARPDFLEPVLASLRAQLGVDWSQREIFLFQDGAVNAYSQVRKAEDHLIDQSVELFKKYFPNGHVFRSEANIGVCENFLRAETHFFEVLKADCAYFFEDDMVLAPQYLQVMDRLAAASIESRFVGYFAAYGHLRASLQTQHQNAARIERIDHHWGFGLVRSHWLELHQWLKPYYDLVVGKEYRRRPTPEILAYFRSRGIPLGVSSQDDVKKIGTYMLGRIGINTFPVLGKYIGNRGEHMNEVLFEKLGFQNSVMYDRPVETIDFPSPERAAQLLEAEINQRTSNIRQSDPTFTATAPSLRLLG
ncbi:hypothetical protein [Microvirga sp. VF16]|uniref:hypothetical protein n=1 Tax=Microvirga sp. VF16 TaxID=2807101 RepID=UPI00193E6235|nr:hypothetical protein [Microvirga sp. VF16]QRM35617.1 hypothetical protein JO965_43090 [Microvirga sp. VF16]